MAGRKDLKVISRERLTILYNMLSISSPRSSKSQSARLMILFLRGTSEILDTPCNVHSGHDMQKWATVNRAKHYQFDKKTKRQTLFHFGSFCLPLLDWNFGFPVSDFFCHLGCWTARPVHFNQLDMILQSCLRQFRQPCKLTVESVRFIPLNLKEVRLLKCGCTERMSWSSQTSQFLFDRDCFGPPLAMPNTSHPSSSHNTTLLSVSFRVVLFLLQGGFLVRNVVRFLEVFFPFKLMATYPKCIQALWSNLALRMQYMVALGTGLCCQTRKKLLLFFRIMLTMKSSRFLWL